MELKVRFYFLGVEFRENCFPSIWIEWWWLDNWFFFFFTSYCTSKYKILNFGFDWTGNFSSLSLSKFVSLGLRITNNSLDRLHFFTCRFYFRFFYKYISILRNYFRKSMVPNVSQHITCENLVYQLLQPCRATILLDKYQFLFVSIYSSSLFFFFCVIIYFFFVFLFLQMLI